MDYRTKFIMTRRLLLITLAGLCLSCILFSYKSRPEIAKEIQFIHAKDTVRLGEFSEVNLNKMMYLLDVEHPDIVMAQAKLETGNFTSRRFKEYNALFGFQTSDKNIIKYKTWKESIIHYSHWQDRRLKQGEDYYEFLIRTNYASDPNYINKLKQFALCQK